MIYHAGRIEVVCGSMFCGKTEELIRRTRRAMIARQNVQVFKHSLDDRYGVEAVTSHTGQNIDAAPVRSAGAILEQIRPETTVVAIDEVQFFDMDIIGVIETLAGRGLRVIVAGLDMDFRGEPFGPIPELMSPRRRSDQAARDLRRLRRGGLPDAATGRWQTSALSRSGHPRRRAGKLRSALPRPSHRAEGLTSRFQPSAFPFSRAIDCWMTLSEEMGNAEGPRYMNRLRYT